MNVPMLLLLAAISCCSVLNDNIFCNCKTGRTRTCYKVCRARILHKQLCRRLWFLMHSASVKFPKTNPENSGSKTIRKKPYMPYNTSDSYKNWNPELTVVSSTSTTEAPRDSLDFISYHSLDKINKYLSKLPWKYPHLASVETIGKSSEGREIKLVKVSTGDVGVKASILIVGGMQGNNWLTSAVVLYAIQQLVENPVNNYMLGKADWYLMPIANPDGYEYSQNINKSWTKTRSSIINNPSICKGVNFNRNFDFNCRTNQSTEDTCKNSFAGTKPFSVNESKALENFVKTYKVNMQVYINIDDFGQSFEFPVNNNGKFARDSTDLKYIANQASYAVSKYGGHTYQVKSLDKINSCGSEHWMRRIGIKYSYKFKLPFIGSGSKYSSKTKEILPVAQEIFVAFREIQRTAVAIYSVTYDLITDD